jgi:hypothetical protein
MLGQQRHSRVFAGALHRSGEIADVLNKKVTQLAPLRNGLIARGIIYSPAHNDTAFTVPLFDQFMQRIAPEEPALGSAVTSRKSAKRSLRIPWISHDYSYFVTRGGDRYPCDRILRSKSHE